MIRRENFGYFLSSLTSFGTATDARFLKYGTMNSFNFNKLYLVPESIPACASPPRNGSVVEVRSMMISKGWKTGNTLVCIMDNTIHLMIKSKKTIH